MSDFHLFNSESGAISISATDVSKSYRLGKRKIEVLHEISFQIHEGELITLTGASGTGKSTLLHLLGGLDVPDSGEILCAGNNLCRLSTAKLNRHRNSTVGFVFQAYHLLPELDALENVCLPARMARTPAKKAMHRGKELLDRVGLKDRMDHRPYELSGGEQQRVALARSLINGPRIILADEPTGNLDSHTGEEIMALIQELHRERGVTLIIATHDPQIAKSTPRRIEMVDGRVAFDSAIETAH